MKAVAVLLICFSGIALAQDRRPLKEFRSQFIGQHIVINDSFSSTTVGFLSDWQFAKLKRGIYVEDYGKSVPTNFVGQEGTIIAIQAEQPVFGPPADQSDDVLVKYAEAFIKTNNGKILATAVFDLHSGENITDAFTLVSVREAHKKESVALAQKLHGESLYFTNLTRIYDEGLPASQLQVAKSGILVSDAEILNFPRLSPIPVVDVEYSDRFDATMIKLALPDGRKAIYVLGCISDQLTEKKYDCPSLTMPAFLTSREVDAIRKGAIYVGMSDIALYMSMGFPQKTNESAIGADQLVYLSAYVYTKNHRVEEIQSQN